MLPKEETELILSLFYLGVILKKARMTKKGRSNSNVPSGCMIETLVILAEDLVQVIAKVLSSTSYKLLSTLMKYKSMR